MGGDRRQLPAAARAARRRCAADAVADAGAVRPARGPRRAGALRDASSRRCAATRTSEDVAGLRAGGHEQLARELERSWGDYEPALERFARRGGDLLGALAPHAQWTSSATHAVLPLLATDAGVRLQVQSGVDVPPRAASGERLARGLLAAGVRHAPWLERALDGRRRARRLRRADQPLRTRRERAPAAARRASPGWCSCRSTARTISLVWSDAGYPAAGAYRDYHHHTVHQHKPWGNDGGAYDHARRAGAARASTPPTSSRARSRAWARPARGLPGGGLAVCALDTELLGHWWYEGVAWLRGGRRGVLSPGPRAGAPGRCAGAPSRAPARLRGRSQAWAGRAAGGRAATCPPGRVRPSPRWPSPRARPSSRSLAAGAARRAPPRCASCSRCRPATGRSWSPARSPRRTRASASRATGGRSRARSPGTAVPRAGAGAAGSCATSPPDVDHSALLIVS